MQTFKILSSPSLPRAGEPTVLKLYPLAVSLKGARAGNGDRHVSSTHRGGSMQSLHGGRKLVFLRWSNPADVDMKVVVATVDRTVLRGVVKPATL